MPVAVPRGLRQAERAPESGRLVRRRIARRRPIGRVHVAVGARLDPLQLALQGVGEVVARKALARLLVYLPLQLPPQGGLQVRLGHLLLERQTLHIREPPAHLAEQFTQPLPGLDVLPLGRAGEAHVQVLRQPRAPLGADHQRVTPARLFLQARLPGLVQVGDRLAAAVRIDPVLGAALQRQVHRQARGRAPPEPGDLHPLLPARLVHLPQRHQARPDPPRSPFLLQVAPLDDAGRVGFHQSLDRLQRLALQFDQVVARPATHPVILKMLFHLFFGFLFVVCFIWISFAKDTSFLPCRTKPAGLIRHGTRFLSLSVSYISLAPVCIFRFRSK